MAKKKEKLKEELKKELKNITPGPEKKEPKDLAKKTKDLPVAPGSGAALIEYALKNKAGVEQLREIMKMKYEDEAREAAKEYHRNFCLMQAEMPTIKKTKKVIVSNEVVYQYAQLEDIINQIKDVMKKYGFTRSWSESFETAGFKKITCHITGHGHSESAYQVLPILPPGKMTNALQQAGSTSTYGKRYSLLGILGITAEDDDDGRGAALPGNTQAPAATPQNTSEPTKYKKPEIDDVISFGKHKGKTYRDAPTAYIEWLRDNDKYDNADALQIILDEKAKGKGKPAEKKEEPKKEEEIKDTPEEHKAKEVSRNHILALCKELGAKDVAQCQEMTGLTSIVTATLDKLIEIEGELMDRVVVQKKEAEAEKDPASHFESPIDGDELPFGDAEKTEPAKTDEIFPPMENSK